MEWILHVLSLLGLIKFVFFEVVVVLLSTQEVAATNQMGSSGEPKTRLCCADAFAAPAASQGRQIGSSTRTLMQEGWRPVAGRAGARAGTSQHQPRLR
ncbi:unnamed protein product [Calypogeia fissa]